MLWQPALPEAYIKMPPAELAAAISARRTQLGDELVILGHHYQTDEIIQHADFTGDSLKLSQTAAHLVQARKGRVKYIIFCGVHFMAETADMLTPDEVAVILPDLSAGCSMADMAQYDDTVEAWNAIHASLKSQGWRGTVVPITYVNSSAAIKAFVGDHGGACCTSSNAKNVFEWAMQQGGGGGKAVAGSDDIKVLFLPDQHLGRNTAAAYGIDTDKETCVYDPRLTRRGEEFGGATPEQLLASKVILWAGHCSVHNLFRPEHCDQIRARRMQVRGILMVVSSAHEGPRPPRVLQRSRGQGGSFRLDGVHHQHDQEGGARLALGDWDRGAPGDASGEGGGVAGRACPDSFGLPVFVHDDVSD